MVQECAVGLVRIRRQAQGLAFAAPALKRSTPSPDVLADTVAALGLTAGQVVAAQLLDNGPVWLGLLVDAPQTVLRLQPDHARLKAMGHKVGVAARYRAAGEAVPTSPALEVRAFATPMGIEEDPVTGSLNASLAQWLIGEGHMPPDYVAAQGSCLQRAGRVHLHQDASGQIWVGGESVTCISGAVVL